MPAVSATMLGTWWHWTAHLPVGSSREEPNMMAGWMKWDCYLLLAATAVCPSSCTGPVYQICSDVEDGESWDSTIPDFHWHRRQALLLPNEELLVLLCRLPGVVS